jgi:hypothetical protein
MANGFGRGRLILAALVLGLLSGSPATALQEDTSKGQPPPPAKKKYTIQDMAWMAGQWVGSMGGGISEDHWSEPQAGMMMGMFRLVGVDGQLKVLEFEIMRETDEGVEFRFRHFSPLLEPWEAADEPLILNLIEIEGDRIVFLNPAAEVFKKNQPHRVVIKREGPDQYSSEVYVKREDAETLFFDMTVRRAGTEKKPDQARAPSLQPVEAGCGACIFEMPGVEDCLLAVKVDGRPYLVEGSSIDDHGNAHAADGLCNRQRQAMIIGEIKGDKFIAAHFELQSLE